MPPKKKHKLFEFNSINIAVIGLVIVSLWVLKDEIYNLIMGNSLISSHLPAVIAESEVKTLNIDTYKVNFYKDGSVAFEVQGQKITVPEKLYKLILTVFEDVDSTSKLKLFIKEVDALIKKNSIYFMQSRVPIEVYVGLGKRIIKKDPNITYGAITPVNAIAIRVKNTLVILEKDHLKPLPPQPGYKYYKYNDSGIYKIQGEFANNALTGDVVGLVETKYAYKGQFKSPMYFQKKGFLIDNGALTS